MASLSREALKKYRELFEDDTLWFLSQLDEEDE